MQVDAVASNDKPTRVTISSKFKDGSAEVYVTDIDAQSLAVLRETARKVANTMAATLPNEHENRISMHEAPGVLMALLKLRQKGVNPMLFVEGQPSYAVLLEKGGGLGHLDQRTIATQLESELTAYYYTQQQANGIRPIGAISPA
jgi:hypothetical protein